MKTHKDGSAPAKDEIFVFGSNLAGRHGAGAARFAFDKLEAEYGVGIGRTGRCYAIPTKDEFIITMSISAIEYHVHQFVDYAKSHPHEKFFLTRIGCGLAGCKDEEIAPMFEALENVNYPEEWQTLVR